MGSKENCTANWEGMRSEGFSSAGAMDTGEAAQREREKQVGRIIREKQERVLLVGLVGERAKQGGAFV